MIERQEEEEEEFSSPAPTLTGRGLPAFISLR